MADVPGTYLALERDEWLTSKEGRGCRDATTLGAPADQSEYLQNRLELAFIAGAEAVERWRSESRILAEKTIAELRSKVAQLTAALGHSEQERLVARQREAGL